MTKIHLVSGFLGAGKTTLIRHLLSDRSGRGRLAIIENEFGQVGLDGALIQQNGPLPIREINSGCICCSLSGDFKSAIRQLMDTCHPDEILIEPSGVGLLSEVRTNVLSLLHDQTGIRAQLFNRKHRFQRGTEASAAQDQAQKLSLGGVVTVVDAQKYERYLHNFGAFYQDQIAQAKDLLVTRTEMLTDQQKMRVWQALRTLNPTARIHFRPLMSRSAQEWNEILLDGQPVREAPPWWQQEAQAQWESQQATTRSVLARPQQTGDIPEMGDRPAAKADSAQSGVRDEAGAAKGDDAALLEALSGGVREKTAHDSEAAIHTPDAQASEEPASASVAKGAKGAGRRLRKTTHTPAADEAGDVFTSKAWQLSACSLATAEALRVALRAGAFGEVVRLKGVVPNADRPGEWLHMEYAGGEWQRGRMRNASRSLLIAIGTDWEPAGLEAFFRAHGLNYQEVDA